MNKTQWQHLVKYLFILSAFFMLAVATYAVDPYVADAHTVLLDHFDNATLAAYVSGTMNYTDGLPGLSQAADFGSGQWLRYVLSGWYTWSSAYNPAGKSGTMECWIYPKQYNVGLVNFNWNNVNSYPSAGHILSLGINSEGKFTCGTWTSITGPILTPLPPSTTTIPLDQWTHVAVTWGDQGTKLYVNGVEDAASPDNLYPALNPTFYVYVPYWGQPNLGYMDELRISSVARTNFNVAHVNPFLTEGVVLYQEDFDSATPGQSLTNSPLNWSRDFRDIRVGVATHPGWSGNAILGSLTQIDTSQPWPESHIGKASKSLSIPNSGVVILTYDAWAYGNQWCGMEIDLNLLDGTRAVSLDHWYNGDGRIPDSLT